MAIKFKKYHRFDNAKAKYGVEHSIYDEVGNFYGTFKTSLFDPFSKYIQVATERFSRENQDNEKMKGDFANTFAFVELCIHDWKDVLDENGKAVKFSKEAAFELLTAKWDSGEADEDGKAIEENNQWLTEKLIEVTRDVRNYKSDPVAKQDEAVKN